MKSAYKMCGIVIFVLLFLSVSAIKSQVSLRKALDYDGDGKADPIVFRTSEDMWYINRSSLGTLQTQFGAADLDTPVPGDYDGDGKGDLAIWRESEGNFYYIQSSNNIVITKNLGQAGDIPVARDYDGDGKTDCAIARRQYGSLEWYVRQSSNNLLVGYVFGLDSDYPAPGDYDGDGKFDIAIRRKNGSNIEFWMYKSSNGSIAALQFGIYTDSFVPGDYDGDGKTDIAVVRWEFRNGDNYEWHRLTSSSNYQNYEVTSFGKLSDGDYPVQADYDGDGKTDIAVWRSNLNVGGLFYVLQSGNGQIANYSWGQVGDLPVATYDTHY